MYRLPTEAAWEYACGGGATSEEECSFLFYLDKPINDLSSKQANFNGAIPFGKGEKGPNLGRPTKVGSYAPNKLGLCDMHGNVWQWCEDLYNPNAKRTLRVIGAVRAARPALAAPATRRRSAAWGRRRPAALSVSDLPEFRPAASRAGKAKRSERWRSHRGRK